MLLEGKIVITGGEKYIQGELKSVKAYDHYKDKWTFLQYMVEKRSYHAAVSMGNKMFVIGGFDTTSSEVFENFPKKFVKLNSEIKFSDFDKYIYALSIGNNIIVFQVALSKNSCLLLRC